jgi:hypothetical protein
MSRHYLIILVAALMLCPSCGRHFISDTGFRKQVEKDYDNRMAMLDSSMASQASFKARNAEEKEAMEFLLAYSPLNDVVTMGPDYFMANVRQAFVARDSMAWGDSIPEYIFRYYVMPVRVNNESLDNFRTDYYDTLSRRVAGMTMQQAALEINHWCHEHVNYQPTDGRTASPEAIMKRTYGRCGEETVFAIAALRTVGIPARQVYTPRWAHCDDNHAWVEVWADGEWHYLGACEPAPKLDEAWFTYPASRGLYMEVKVFGRYFGEEDIVGQDPIIARINCTANYAPVSRPTVHVVDASGKPVPGASVAFKVYNYSELYTVFNATCDSEGKCSLAMGRGDRFVWASDPASGTFGFVKAGASDTSAVTVILSSKDAVSEKFEIVPPAGKPVFIDSNSPEEVACLARLASEDAIRNAVIADFPKTAAEAFTTTTTDEDEPADKSAAFGFDISKLDRAVVTSRGNWKMIPEVIRQASSKEDSPGLVEFAVNLLNNLSDKDLQDANPDVILSNIFWWYDSRNASDTLKLSNSPYTDDFASRYIVLPRVLTEQMDFWRSDVSAWLAGTSGAAELKAEAAAVAAAVPEAVKKVADAAATLVAEKIRVVDSTSRGDVFMTPAAVAKSGVCDAVSRDIFYIACLRTLGIPARLNPVDRKPQFFADGSWATSEFNAKSGTGAEGGIESWHAYGSLVLTCKGGAEANPLYYVNFTVSKLENGKLKLLDLGDSSEGDLSDKMRCNSIFKTPVLLEAGEYIIVTGNRRGDGSVVSTLQSIIIRAGEQTNAKLSIESALDAPVGKIPASAAAKLFGSAGGGKMGVALILSTSGEPSTHLMNDLAALKKDFEGRGVRFTVLYEPVVSTNASNKPTLAALMENDRGKLPAGSVFGKDDGSAMFNMLTSTLKLNREYPLIVVGAADGTVAYAASGYGINQGVRILRFL